MFESLFSSLDTFEKGMADKSLKSSRKTTLNLLTSIVNQSTVLLQPGVKLPQGSRSILTRIKKIASDCVEGIRTQDLTFSELRSISQHKIGVLSKALKVSQQQALTIAQRNKVREHEAADDVGADANIDFAGEPAVAVKIGEIRKLLSKSSLSQGTNLTPHIVKTMKLIEESMERLKALFGKLSKKQLSAIDAEEFVANHSLEEIAHISIEELRELSADVTDEEKALSESYKKYYSRLPVKLTSPFSAFQYPIVPIFTKDVSAHMDNGKLERAGFKVTRIGDHFLVLENQHLLALDMERLGIESSLRADRKGRLKSVKGQGSDNNPNSPVGRVLEAINKQSPVKYAPASTQMIRNPRNPKIALMWIITEHSRTALARSLNSTELVWDIPRSTIDE